MGLGHRSCYLKTLLQTFGSRAATALMAPHLRIISIMASDCLGGLGGMGGRRVEGRNLIFKLKRTE